jgi:hypothetical protein
MIRWASLLFLSACSGDPTGGRPLEDRVTGLWSLTVPGTPERVDLQGTVIVAEDMSASYRLSLPRPTDLPPCDPAEVRLQENWDLVILILSPESELRRRELHGILRGDRIVGRWTGESFSIWAGLQRDFLLQRIEPGTGVTNPCEG